MAPGGIGGSGRRGHPCLAWAASLGVLLAGCATVPKVGPGVRTVSPRFHWPERGVVRTLAEPKEGEEGHSVLFFRIQGPQEIVVAGESGGGPVMVPKFAEGFAHIRLDAEGHLQAVALDEALSRVTGDLGAMERAMGQAPDAAKDDAASGADALVARMRSFLGRVFRFLRDSVEYLWWAAVDTWIGVSLEEGIPVTTTVPAHALPKILSPAGRDVPVVVTRRFVGWVPCEAGAAERRCVRLRLEVGLEEAVQAEIREALRKEGEEGEAQARLFEQIWRKGLEAEVVTDPLTLLPRSLTLSNPAQEEGGAPAISRVRFEYRASEGGEEGDGTGEGAPAEGTESPER
ncbi:MAG: hypothetical protein D6729_16365 [Deltaproteobacteria bacterium]|nr:MAG: hypothetical protein D6729_16365 [Deltaproteobacteria bacterium]